jgi:hypothetical protein
VNCRAPEEGFLKSPHRPEFAAPFTGEEKPADPALPDDREATLTFVPALDGLREITLPPLVAPTRTSRA